MLPARLVIHAVGPIWRGGGAGEADLLASAYRTSLDLAAAEGARTVTFPAISCGIYGYPLDAAATIALGTVRTWLDERPGAIDSVTFVLFSHDTLEAFERARAAT
jgi:O-acetyl-ADP-ribose deacetylase (regulator of RNase III)